STPTVPTTTTSTATWYGPGASTPSSPAAAPNTAPDSVSTAGSSSKRSRCCTGSAACASAGKSAMTSTKPSSASPAASSAGADSRIAHCVRTSKKGHQHGYYDGWGSDGLFHYVGAGQRGDRQRLHEEGHKVGRMQVVPAGESRPLYGD